MEMPKQVRCLLNNCISNFLDTPQEESCANFKTETLKHLSDFKLSDIDSTRFAILFNRTWMGPAKRLTKAFSAKSFC
jgi:hypothetical protein